MRAHTQRGRRPPGPRATRESEARLFLPSAGAARAGLRLCSAPKSSSSSWGPFPHTPHAHSPRAHGGAETSPDGFRVAFSIQFIGGIFTQRSAHI